MAGFDNIALGMLTVFQCTTLAGWAQVMYRTMDSGTYLHFQNPGRLFGPITLTECSNTLRKTDTFRSQSQGHERKRAKERRHRVRALGQVSTHAGGFETKSRSRVDLLVRQTVNAMVVRIL